MEWQLGIRPQMQLRVVSGPDAGSVHVLGRGRVRIGRGNTDVRLDDPMMSREHAELDVTAYGVTVRDVGSTNGTWVDGRKLHLDALPLAPGAMLRVGESLLTLVVDDEPLASVTPNADGWLGVNRPPRLPAPLESVEITLPGSPPARQGIRFPLIAMLLQVVVTVPMVFHFGQQMLALLVLSPVMLAGGYLGERLSARRAASRDHRRYEQELAATQARIDEAVTTEAHHRQRAAPDAATLLWTALGPRPRLWERRPADQDFLTLRLGVADLPSRVRVRSPQAAGGGDRTAYPLAADVPVTVSLATAGVLGIAGPRPRVEALVRCVMAQLAGLHSPQDLEIVVCAPDSADGWEWVRWLPHLRPTAGQDCALLVGLDEQQVSARTAELVGRLGRGHPAAPQLPGTGGGSGRRTVIVLDGARRLRGLVGVARLLRDGPAVGIHAICLADDAAALPTECGATAVIQSDVGTRLRVSVSGEEPVTDVIPDLVTQDWADCFAAALSPLRDATPDAGESALPTVVRLLDLIRLEPPPAPHRIAAGWHGGAPSTAAVIGVGADGVLQVDLRTDGPHALIAGTTGAGKSELLQTLIVSLALVNPPDALSFLLIDYKGGAAFRECAALPHTGGLVTDLDPQLTVRALRSLDAELARRERVLHNAGCKDIEHYQKANSPNGRVARLVIVIDEFATLAEELPEFIIGLVDIARRGRSLGVHLVLATQRPAGVVSADIRANMNLRIALRVTDPAESQDVIGSAVAASISAATPGRAYFSAGGAEVTGFQSASVGGRGRREDNGTRDGPATVAWRAAGDPVTTKVSEFLEETPTDLGVLVAALQEAAASSHATTAPSPWLPPLDDVVEAASLARVAPAATATLPVGLIDVPDRQCREVFGIELGGGHWMAAGGPRSGRSTLLRTIAGVVARDHDVGDVHIYGLDCAGGALLPLAALPHCGALASRDQLERGTRIISRLLVELTRRQELLSAHGFASVAEQRAKTAPEERLPWLLLLLDGWDGFLSTYEAHDHGRPVEQLFRLLREGPGAGLTAVVTGDRSLLTGRISSLVAGRLLLTMPDPRDFGLAGVAAREVPTCMPPGRALLPTAEGGYETQLALLTADASGPAQLAALQDLGRAAHDRAEASRRGPHPFRVEQLPARLALADLFPAALRDSAARGPLWMLVGVGGDELDMLGVDPAIDGPAFVIAGPRGSGRSTTLLMMAQWYAARGVRVVAVTPRESVLNGIRADVDELAGVLNEAGAQPLAVLVDDAEALLDTPIEAVLLDLLHERGQRVLVVAGSSDRMAATYRGLTVEARSGRCGLLLAPSGPMDGDLLDVRSPPIGERRPGRGVLAVRGVVTPVQVPLP